MIFEPGIQEEDPKPPELTNVFFEGPKGLRSMMRFREEHSVEDFTFLAHRPSAPPVSRKRTRPVPKVKGGRRPKDFDLADTWIDFCKAYDEARFREAKPLYHQLRKALYS